LILLNDSIDFVERFHWICSTISLVLLPENGRMTSRKRQFAQQKAADEPEHSFSIGT
jgi:hypothetical protein